MSEIQPAEVVPDVDDNTAMEVESSVHEERFAGIGPDMLAPTVTATCSAITIDAVGSPVPLDKPASRSPSQNGFHSNASIPDAPSEPRSLAHADSVGSNHLSLPISESEPEPGRSNPSDSEPIGEHKPSGSPEDAEGANQEQAEAESKGRLRGPPQTIVVNLSGSESEVGSVGRSPQDDATISANNFRSAITHALHETDESIRPSAGSARHAQDGVSEHSSREVVWVRLLQSARYEALAAAAVFFTLIAQACAVIHPRSAAAETGVLSVNFCVLLFILGDYALRRRLRQRTSLTDLILCLTLLPDACWLFGQVDMFHGTLPLFSLIAIRAAAGSRRFFALARTATGVAGGRLTSARPRRRGRGIRGNLERCVEAHNQLAACLVLAVAFTCAAVSAGGAQGVEAELRGDLGLLAFAMVAVEGRAVVEPGWVAAYVERQGRRGYGVEGLWVGEASLYGGVESDRAPRLYPREVWEVQSRCTLEAGTAGAGEAVASSQQQQPPPLQAGGVVEVECGMRVSLRGRARAEGVIALVVVFVVVCTLFALNLILSHQLSQYVVNPVERMLQTIESLSQEPLKPIEKPAPKMHKSWSSSFGRRKENKASISSAAGHHGSSMPLNLDSSFRPREGSRLPSQRGDAASLGGGSFKSLAELSNKGSRDSDASLNQPDILSTPLGMRHSGRTPRQISPITPYVPDAAPELQRADTSDLAKDREGNGQQPHVGAAWAQLDGAAVRPDGDEQRRSLVESFKRLLPAPKRRETVPNGQHALSSREVPSKANSRSASHSESVKSDKHIRKARKSIDSTLIVENALHSFGSLLQLAFGEAGARIISGNLHEGTVNPNAMSDVVYACFGFCDIRQFTDLTEVLQGDIVFVVNKIAEHVHTSVLDNLGAPNKNIGDAFLSVWKVKQEQLILAEMLAAASLWSTVRIMRDIALCPEINACAARPDVQARLPGFRVSLGFGLHFGWAIECAIGSQHKIDASYLSPHVNLASRLEAATKQYGVPVLFSEEVFQYLPPTLQAACRLLDRVTVKGSTQPLHVYTWDFYPYSGGGGGSHSSVEEAEAAEARMRQGGEWEAQCTPEELLLMYPLHTTEGFRQLFARAVKAYLGGPSGAASDWQEAKRLLQECARVRPGDGPSEQLLAFVSLHAQPGGDAPAWWRGWRLLGEK